MKRLLLLLLSIFILSIPHSVSADTQVYGASGIPYCIGLPLDNEYLQYQSAGSCYVGNTPSGGSMTWPGGDAGIPNYTGLNSWGTSYNSSNTIPYSFLDPNIESSINLYLRNMLSTALLGGGLITINTDTTKFDIAAGSGLVVDNYTDPLNPTLTYVTWNQTTGITDPFLNTDANTYVYVTSAGTFTYSNLWFTPEERRDFIVLGWTDHPDLTYITDARIEPVFSTDLQAQLTDFLESFGVFNIDGNIYSAATGTQIQRSSGTTFDNNANYFRTIKSPHIITTPSENPAAILYFYRAGGGLWVNDLAPVMYVDPTHWDDNSGVLQVVPTDKFTIQIISFYANFETNDIQYGQVVYDSMAEADAAVQTDVELNDYNFPWDTPRAWLITRNSTTNLSNAADAKIITIGRFGFGTGGGGTGGAPPGNTVVSETTYGQSPVVGTAIEHSRKDHSHGTPSGADLTGESFITSAASTTLTNERVMADGTNTTIDTGTAGQVKVNLSGTIPLSFITDDVTANKPLLSGGTGDPAYAAYKFAGTAVALYTFPSTTNTLAANDGSNWTISGQAIGDIPIASSPTAYGKLSAVAAKQPLMSNGLGAAPIYAGYYFSAVSAQTYTFPSTTKTIAANDGSNLTISGQAIGDIPVASSTTAYGKLAAVAAKQPLVSNGAGVAPIWGGYYFSATSAQTYTFPTVTKTLAANDGSNWTFGSQAIGDIAYATSTTAYGRLADVAIGSPLLSGGVGNAPAYATYMFSATSAQTYTFPTTSKTLMASDYSNAGTAPTWNQNTTGSAAILSATLPTGTGGTGVTDFSFSGSAHKVGSAGFTNPASNKCVEVDASGNLQIAGSNAVCGSGGGYATIQDEGIAQTQRSTLDFRGAGIACADELSSKTTCTVSGGGSVTFDAIGSGINTTMTGTCGTGCLLTTAGTGTIRSNVLSSSTGTYQLTFDAANSLSGFLKSSASGTITAAGAMAMLNVKDYGATGDGSTNDTTAIQAAITAAIAGHGGRGVDLFFPEGIYRTTTTLTVLGSNVRLIGAGVGSTVIYPDFTTGDVIQFGNGTIAYAQMGFMHMQIYAPASHTSGAGINIQYVADMWIDDFSMTNMFIGVQIGPAANPSLKVHVTNGTINATLATTGIGIYVLNGLGGDTYIDNIVMSNNPASKPAAGIRITQSGHTSILRVNITSALIGLDVNPGASQDVQYLFIDHSLFDSGGTHGARFAPTNATGRIRSVTSSNTWYSGSLVNYGIEIGGVASSTVDDMSFIGCRILNNYQHGVYVSYASANNITFTDCTIAGNGQQTVNTYDGINVVANTNGISIVNSKIGQAGTAGNQQRYALNIPAGTSGSWQVLGNDFSLNGTVGSGSFMLLGALTGHGNKFVDNNPQVSMGSTSARITASAAINTTNTIISLPYRVKANSLAAGTVIRVTAFGTCTSTAANISTFRMYFGANGTTADTLILTTATTAAATSGTNIAFKAVWEIVVRTIGSGTSATIYGGLNLRNHGITGIVSSAQGNVIAGTAAGFNSTADGILSLAYQSAAATTTSTFQQVIIETVRPGL